MIDIFEILNHVRAAKVGAEPAKMGLKCGGRVSRLLLTFTLEDFCRPDRRPDVVMVGHRRCGQIPHAKVPAGS